MTALAALGTAAALPWGAGRAAGEGTAPRRVDVHHHFFPPGYLERLPEVAE